MSDSDTIEDIKQRKREELLGSGDDAVSGDGDAAGVPDSPVHVESTDHFAELTGKHDVVLVDFYADWCGPCRQLEPIVEEVAATTDAAVAKVDVDRHQELAGQYGVRGVPTMVLFSGGEAVEQMVGVRTEDQLTGTVENYA
ncbi:MAG: thioredoxin [Halobacteriales archaeon]